MMTTEQAYKVLLLTLANDGGTFNPDGTPYEATTGYSVAIMDPVDSSQVDIDDSQEKLTEIIRLLSTHWKLNAENRKVGTWIEGNTMHLDIVLVEDDINFAMSVGVLHNQQAIWSFRDSEAIYI